MRVSDTANYIPHIHTFLYSTTTSSMTTFGHKCVAAKQLKLTVAGLLQLCLAGQGDLVVPRTRTDGFGPRSFSVAGLLAWNSLSPEMKTTDTRQFSVRLKTSLTERQTKMSMDDILEHGMWPASEGEQAQHQRSRCLMVSRFRCC